MVIRRPFPWPLAFVSFIYLFGLASPAHAQEQRLFALANTADAGSGDSRAQLIEARIVGGQIVSASVRAEVPGQVANGRMVAAAGGQFVIWPHAPAGATSDYVAAFDRSSGRSLLVPVGSGFLHPVADPVNPRVFFWRHVAATWQLASLSANGVAAVPGTEGLELRGVSRDGERLYAARRASGPGFISLDIVDASTGHLLRSVPFPAPQDDVSRVAVNDDESAAWLYTKTITPASGTPLPSIPAMETWTLRRFDLATGAETLTVPGDTYPTHTRAVSYDGPFFDGTTQSLVVATNARENNTGRSSLGSTVRVVDPASGAILSEAAADGWSTLYLDHANQAWLNVDQRFTVGPFSPMTCHQVGVRAGTLPASGTPLASVFGGLPCLTFAFASTPGAPEVNPPAVTPDRTVSLSWSGPVEPTTGYVVEAGTEPGLANIGVFSVSGQALTVANVPPGHYHVRVRAVNGIGAGVGSSEIQIDVP